jgi:hypothetical protein
MRSYLSEQTHVRGNSNLGSTKPVLTLHLGTSKKPTENLSTHLGAQC